MRKNRTDSEIIAWYYQQGLAGKEIMSLKYCSCPSIKMRYESAIKTLNSGNKMPSEAIKLLRHVVRVYRRTEKAIKAFHRGEHDRRTGKKQS